jgi:hypothetical protein
MTEPVVLPPGLTVADAMKSILVMFSAAFFLSLTLTPLVRDSIFTRPFLDFLATAQADSASGPGRRLEREVRSIELLSSEEKLMAGLPNFATYFGRDMLMAALMMRPIWRPGMSEHVIASALRKLSPRGDVSHEEALAGQAIREHGKADAEPLRRIAGEA